MRTSLIAAFSFLATAASAAPAAAWEQIGVKDVTDRTERDIIHVEGAEHYRKIKICVFRNPIRFYDLDIRFRNGDNQDVNIAKRINPGNCTRTIDLDGGRRNIELIRFVYEETSFRRTTATVRVFAK